MTGSTRAPKHHPAKIGLQKGILPLQDRYDLGWDVTTCSQTPPINIGAQKQRCWEYSSELGLGMYDINNKIHMRMANEKGRYDA